MGMSPKCRDQKCISTLKYLPKFNTTYDHFYSNYFLMWPIEKCSFMMVIVGTKMKMGLKYRDQKCISALKYLTKFNTTYDYFYSNY